LLAEISSFGQAVGHGLLAAGPAVLSNHRIARAVRRSGRTFDGHLIRRAADPPALHFHHRFAFAAPA